MMSFDIGFNHELQPLARRLANDNFQQQGQVDWVSLTSGSVEFSMGILSRLSAASVDPYTVTVGHFIGNCFELSRGGRRNIENSLSRLKCKSSISDAIWFGFGLRHIVHSISMTEQGATFIALCASLTECFSEETSAEILGAIVRQRAKNTNLAPAVSQWQTLVHCIAGTFAATSFPIRAETLMRMKLGYSGQRCPDPEQIADVLLGVSNVSKGLWKSITILGPREAGWAAAVAEWLFDLTVSITDEDGTLKHSSCPPGQIAQIQVFYIRGKLGEETLSSLQLTDKVFDLRSSMDFMKAANAPRDVIDVTPRSGRIAWKDCLSATFGLSFDELMQMETTVGQLIGGAGAIFEAITTAKGGIPHKLLAFNRFYFESAFGIGFVQNTLQWFPELARIKASMYESCIADDFSNSRIRYETRLGLLRSGCGCVRCSPSSQRPADISRNRLCLVVIVETIIVMSRLLSAVDLDADLAPFLRGLQRAYNRQRDKRSALAKYAESDGQNGLGVLEFILDPTPKHSPNENEIDQIVSCRVVGDRSFDKDLLTDLLSLFAGRDLSDLNKPIQFPYTVSVGGICVYPDILREVSDNSELLGRMHIIPGTIEYNEKPYSCIEERTPPVFSIWQQNPPWDKLADNKLMAQTNVRVHETARSLAIELNILDEEGQEVGIAFRPYHMMSRARVSRGLVACDSQHRAIGDILPQEMKDRLDAAGIEFRVLRAPTLGRCAALALLPSAMILRRDECLACCVKTELRINAQEIYIISS